MKRSSSPILIKSGPRSGMLAQRAVSALERFLLSLSVCDYEVARQIRGQPNGKNIVLSALTGYGQDSDRRTSAEAGFDHPLVKPARFEQLLPDSGHGRDQLTGTDREPSPTCSQTPYGEIENVKSIQCRHARFAKLY